MRGLTAFDRRLSPQSPRPLTVAFSGGGDSLALLLLTKQWADAHGRRVVALTVDHGLQPASAEWTERCRATAARLGIGFEALRWEGEKPTRGLPAAAREARHRLLVNAARGLGAKVLLMGHTADDLLEAAAMRADGSTVPDPREWAPSPAWPEGRGVFVLRPLLETRRAELREWLTERGETWIDDPANEDPRFARARARRLAPPPPWGEGAGGGGVSSASVGVAPPPQPLPARGRGFSERFGVLRAERPLTEPEVAVACLCAAGTTRPPRGDRLHRLTQRLNSAETFTATLAGSRIEASPTSVLFMRDAGETARGGLQPIRLAPNQPTVWDGRFEVTATDPATVAPLKGHSARLPPKEREALRAVPVAARAALPILVTAEGVTCPLLAQAPTAKVTPLALERFRAAMGFIECEEDL
ncbi:MAG: tRNA lysidine(34) synthetase TilS [Parcubacteria group bacterium]